MWNGKNKRIFLSALRIIKPQLSNAISSRGHAKKPLKRNLRKSKFCKITIKSFPPSGIENFVSSSSSLISLLQLVLTE